MEKFSIAIDHKNSKTKIITCPAKGLHIIALHRHYDIRSLPQNALLLTAAFYDDKLPSDEMIANAKYRYFQVTNTDSPYRSEWRMKLFYDAIDYYCKNYLKVEHGGIRHSSGSIWYPFDFDEDDDLSCLYPDAAPPTAEEIKDFDTIFNSGNGTAEQKSAARKVLDQAGEGLKTDDHEGSNI